jgi:hypothetical protein
MPASNTIIILKRRKTSVVDVQGFNLEGASYCFKRFISTTPFIPDIGALQPNPIVQTEYWSLNSGLTSSVLVSQAL